MKQFVIAFFLLASAPAYAIAASDFAKIDADGDGEVKIDELRASGINWNEEAFSAADSDSDGALSEAEFDTLSAEQK